MKKIYKTKVKFLSGLILFLFLPGMHFLNAQFPVPDQAFTFNDTDTTYHTQVTDISGNDNHGYWWAYRNGQDDMYAKYDPDGGMFGGSWHISGYHICCEEMASPSMDFILLAGNKQAKDAEGFREESPLYHQGFTSLSVAFWFRSDRDYSLSHEPCPPLENGMHEQEILFSLGSGNSLALSNFKGYYEVRIGQKPPEGVQTVQKIAYLYDGEGAAEKEWQHIAITFDGENNGSLAVYIDGELGTPYLGDPNPLETGFSELYPQNSSVELGAQNSGGLFGNVSAFWGTNAIGTYCITAEDTSYRTGWPASGDYDDFVFYKNTVLSPEQVQQLVSTGIKNLLSGETAVPATKSSPYSIYPNPAQDVIRVTGKDQKNIQVEVFNLLGSKVLHKEARPNSGIDISFLEKGLYIIKINNEHTSKLLIK